MNQLSMDDVFKVIHRLPSLPTVVMEFLASIDQDDVDVDTLVDKVAQDQALTAKILRLANSSFYGRTNGVHAMGEAIAVLGFRTVRSVVTTTGLMQSMGQGGGPASHLKSFWRHAIAAAVCARELAPYLRVNADHAYTAGLLHDIGRLVLGTQLVRQFEAVRAHRAAHNCGNLEAERAVLGLDHAAIGQALAAHWKFPVHLQLAVGLHHAQQVPPDEVLTLVVMAADAISHALDFSGEPDDAVANMLPQLWSRLGLEDKTLLNLFGRMERQFAVAAQLLEN